MAALRCFRAGLRCVSSPRAGGKSHERGHPAGSPSQGNLPRTRCPQAPSLRAAIRLRARAVGILGGGGIPGAGRSRGADSAGPSPPPVTRRPGRLWVPVRGRLPSLGAGGGGGGSCSRQQLGSLPARWARGAGKWIGCRGGGDRRASDRFWARAPPEGSPVYLSESPVSLPLRVSAAASPRSEAAAPETNGPTWPLPPAAGAGRLPAARVPAAPRARLPRPAPGRRLLRGKSRFS